VEEGNELATHPDLLTPIDGIVEDPQVTAVALDLDAAGLVITAMYVFATSHPLAPRCRHWCLGSHSRAEKDTLISSMRRKTKLQKSKWAIAKGSPARPNEEEGRH
jgi:hypothetical protein